MPVLEPTPTGHRLRLAARSLPVTVAGRDRAVRRVRGAAPPGDERTGRDDVRIHVLELLLPALLALVGGGAVGMNVLRLRRWAEDRERRHGARRRARPRAGRGSSARRTGLTSLPHGHPRGILVTCPRTC